MKISYPDVAKSCILTHPLLIHLCKVMQILGKKLSTVLVNVDKLTDEWNQYCLEDIKEEWYQSNDGEPLRTDRTDYYWSKIEIKKDDMGHTK